MGKVKKHTSDVNNGHGPRHQHTNGGVGGKMKRGSLRSKLTGGVHHNKLSQKTRRKKKYKQVSSLGKWMITEKEVTNEERNAPSTQNVTRKNGKSEEKTWIFPSKSDGKQVVLVLDHPQTITVGGRANIQCLHGGVKAFGFHIKPNGTFYPVFSPQTNSLITIETCDSKDGAIAVCDLLPGDKEDFNHVQIQKAMTRVKNPVLLLVANMDSSAMDFISSFSKTQFLFTGSDVGGLELGSTGLSLCTKDTLNQLSLPSNFQSVTDWLMERLKKADVSPPVITVCGGRNVGKSTLTRYIINFLLNLVPEVAHLECDLGQTEFTPSGCLTLTSVTEPAIGPPFTHQRTSVCRCYYGMLSPVDDPRHYVECLSYVHKKYSTMKCPLVVNTMGFSRGIGPALLIDSLRLVHSDLIVQINSPNRSKTLEQHTRHHVTHANGWMTQSCSMVASHTLINVDSPITPEIEHHLIKKYDAKVHRTLCTMVMLGQMTSHTTTDLNALVPVTLPWHKVALFVSHISVPNSQMLYALNASIVALCCIDEDEMVHPNIEGSPKFLKRRPTCPSLGFGLIRGIDPEKKVFYILTALPPGELSNINCLIRGALDLPDMFLLDSGEKVSFPYIDKIKANALVGRVENVQFLARRQSPFKGNRYTKNTTLQTKKHR